MSYTHAEMTQFERDAAASSDPPIIVFILPGIRSYCHKLGVTVHWEDFVKLVFVFKGIEFRAEQEMFERMVENNQYESIYTYLKGIYTTLKNTYMRMDC